MNINKINSVYFIGIGGIGMSALARYFNNIGKKVYGYDKTSSVLTDKLVEEGIFIHFEDRIENFPVKVDLVVYTPAISENNKVLFYAKKNNYILLKRSEVLGNISKNYSLIAVAGTHGKTSVSSLAAHILYNSKIGCTSFLGGIAKNYQSNLLIDNNSEVMVIEADEYDRTFLQFFPELAIITSIDSDHLDIYKNKKNLEKAFFQFVENVSETGILLLNTKVNIDKNLFSVKKIITYGIDEVADYRAVNIRMNNNYTLFDIKYKQETISDIRINEASYFMIENAVVAVAASILYGVSEKEIIKSIASFKGINRRFEYVIKEENIVYIDDYAHHPVEINSSIEAVRKLFPEKKLTVVFQPHLYSRTKDYAVEFAESLSLADDVILLDVYPARELPIKGVDSSIIYNDIKTNKLLCTKEEVVNNLKKNKREVILTLGAGDIDRLVEPIKELCLKMYL